MSEIDRTCEFCGCHTNAALRRCCEKGMTADKRRPSDIDRITSVLIRDLLASELDRPRIQAALHEYGDIVREECAKECELVRNDSHWTEWPTNVNMEKDMDTNTGKDTFKIGDRVYVIGYGIGMIYNMNHSTITVQSDCTKFIRMYTLDGFPLQGGCEQVVFHDKPTIIPPKRKIKKFRVVYESFAKKEPVVSTSYYSDVEINEFHKITKTTKLPWTEIEVEESTPVYEELLLDPRN